MQDLPADVVANVSMSVNKGCGRLVLACLAGMVCAYLGGNAPVESDERQRRRNLVVLSAMLGAGAGCTVGSLGRLPPSGVYLPRR